MTLQELTKYFKYLDALRKSGRTNMWRAPTYLQKELGMEQRLSRKVFAAWQDSFDGISTAEVRAEQQIGVFKDG